MKISATLMLTIGLIAALLFVAVFIVSLILTMRNRRLIQRYAENTTEETANDSEQSDGQ